MTRVAPTIVVQPFVVRACLDGFLFDRHKSFLLPAAVQAGGSAPVNQLRHWFAQHKDTVALVIGHTDRSGVPSYNDLLSLERAETFVAYLRQDVGCWLAWFGQDRPSEKCWSVREDRLMFATIAPTLSDPRIAIAWGAK